MQLCNFDTQTQAIYTCSYVTRTYKPTVAVIVYAMMSTLGLDA